MRIKLKIMKQKCDKMVMKDEPLLSILCKNKPNWLDHSTSSSLNNFMSRKKQKNHFKAMDDIGVVMTPFGDVVTVSLVANSYVVGFFLLKSGVVEVY